VAPAGVGGPWREAGRLVLELVQGVDVTGVAQTGLAARKGVGLPLGAALGIANLARPCGRLAVNNMWEAAVKDLVGTLPGLSGCLALR